MYPTFRNLFLVEPPLDIAWEAGSFQRHEAQGASNELATQKFFVVQERKIYVTVNYFRPPKLFSRGKLQGTFDVIFWRFEEPVYSNMNSKLWCWNKIIYKRMKIPQGSKSSVGALRHMYLRILLVMHMKQNSLFYELLNNRIFWVFDSHGWIDS